MRSAPGARTACGSTVNLAPKILRMRRRIVVARSTGGVRNTENKPARSGDRGGAIGLATLMWATAVTAQADHGVRRPTDGIGSVVAQAAAPGPWQRSATVPAVCSIVPLALQGRAMATGGTLRPFAWGSAASAARSGGAGGGAGGGAIAFVAHIAGAARNQGVFVADGQGVRTVAIGCGGTGGAGSSGACGDPAPGGGTFGGMFLGAAPAPAIDRRGNVLFVADLNGAASPRGLFLFDVASAAIVRIAAVGDAAPTPTGATFAAVGAGVVADVAGAGCTVAFVAQVARPLGSGGTVVGAAEFFWWRGGMLHRLAAIGDAAPGGGAFTALATESLVLADGTTLPIGPLPALQDCGSVAFRAHVGGSSGIVVRAKLSDPTDPTGDTWYLRTGDVAPGGGAFAAFEAPVLNGSGAVAVFADVAVGATTTSGWFVGRPGAFRRALAFFDPVDGGQCLGLAVSRGPMVPLDDAGDLSVWCDLALDGSGERLVECRADGSLQVLARRGGATPVGGTFGTFLAWPSRPGPGRTIVSAQVQGSTVLDGHFVAIGCLPSVAASPCAQVGDCVWVDDDGPSGAAFVLAASPVATDLPLPPWGTLRIGPSPLFVLLPPTGYPAAGPHASTWPVPSDIALAGIDVHFQSLALGAPTDRLTNRATTRLVP